MDHSDHDSMDMGGMDMNSSSRPCKISMLFNFYTTDACFLADTWQITSKGMFAGSCIGVILLTMSLEFLRRAVKTYDRYLIRQHELSFSSSENLGPSGDSGSETGRKQPGSDARCAPVVVTAFRPNALQQAVRALLHMVQFAVAYIIMLLAMYFNVYIIICIFIGAFLGAYIFHWENLTNGGRQITSAAREVTVCCA